MRGFQTLLRHPLHRNSLRVGFQPLLRHFPRLTILFHQRDLHKFQSLDLFRSLALFWDFLSQEQGLLPPSFSLRERGKGKARKLPLTFNLLHSWLLMKSASITMFFSLRL
jgi:hypothetical protein